MRVLLLFIPLLQAESLAIGEVSGYVGESVTLPSGVDPSWNLSSIEWTIFANDTWIADRHSGKTNENRFWRYEGRLKLNISSGDLGISGLTREDAMVYTVALKERNRTKVRNKVCLTVKDRLSQPIIHQFLGMEMNKGHCRLALQCTSPDKGVVFTWQAQPAINVSVWTPSDNISYLFAFFSLDHKVDFTCTASMEGQNTSSFVTKGCLVLEEKLKEAQSFAWGGYVLSFFVGSATATGAFLLYCLVKGNQMTNNVL